VNEEAKRSGNGQEEKIKNEGDLPSSSIAFYHCCPFSIVLSGLLQGYPSSGSFNQNMRHGL
jgi:hypothetical protein